MLMLTGCTIRGNVAQHFGGGVYNQATATIAGCTISGNTAQINGGGLETGINAVSTLTGCTISGNIAQGNGGGLENYSRTMLTNCTISGNSASASGGGVSNSGTVMLAACTISGNVASVSSGGLYNHDFLDLSQGVATLTDTIVGANTTPGSSLSDIGGPEAGRVTGSFNLIGPGSSGGIQGGIQGNIVLASLAGVGLAPLGNYGGPTQTIALLPGSPALRAGTALSGVTFDQRGLPLDTPVDIGAFQSQGFLLSLASGTSPQSAPTGEAFANPLSVTVVARNPSEPVAGGIVTFAVQPNGGGAAANLSATTAIIGADDRAMVTATANAIEGTYIVIVSAAGGLTVPPISLTNLSNNLIHLAFTGLTDESVSFGTATVTLTGTLANGAHVPPPGEAVAVTLGGATQQALIGAGGGFTTTFATAGLTVAGSPYTINFLYATDGTFASSSTMHTLTVTKARPSVSVSDPGGTFNNTVFPAMATVAGLDNVAATNLEGVAPSVIYYSGTHTADELAGLVPLNGAPSHAGAYTVVARFAGSPDYAATQSEPANFTIGRATTTVALHASVGSAFFGQPVTVIATATTAGTPQGTVTFFDGTNPLATVALDGFGQARLTTTSLAPGSHHLTASYSGDSDRLGGTSPDTAESTAQARTRVVLVPHPVFQKKKLVSVGLSAVVAPVAPGAGIPSGVVKLAVKKKTLGMLALRGGHAMLRVAAGSVLNKPITVVYGGDGDFQGSQVTSSALTPALLRSLARPVAALVERMARASSPRIGRTRHE
jgi:hypothetical protein